MNKAFARLVAHIQGDGLLQFRKNKELFYYNKEMSLIKQFRKDLKSEYGIDAWRPTWHQTEFVTGTAIVKVVREFLKFSDKKRVPQQILISSKPVKREYLRAIFDDEGTANLFDAFDKRRNNYNKIRRVKLYCKYSSFLLGIKSMLREFDVDAKINGPYNGAYELVIMKKENLKRFYLRVGFNLSRKDKILANIIKSYNS
jgi:intein/homing endonuclease